MASGLAPTENKDQRAKENEEESGVFRQYFTEEKSSHEYPRPARGFLVAAELRLTKDKGVGVFATEFIPAHTRVNNFKISLYNEQQVREILDKLHSDSERADWLAHAYGEEGNMVAVDHDDGGFLNHDDNPNLYTNPEDDNDYTACDILPGEELTEDYGQYDDVQFYDELCEQYGVFDEFVAPKSKENHV